MPNHSPGRTLRIFIWGILVGWALWLLRRVLLSAARTVARKSSAPPAPPKRIALYRDPWCGTHISPEISFTLEQAGQIEHFCSAECRDQYLQSHRRAVSA
jgi:YHS domain-containing protein